MTHSNAGKIDERGADEAKADGEAGARHGQVTGAWRVLLISLGLAVVATAIVAALVSGG